MSVNDVEFVLNGVVLAVETTCNTLPPNPLGNAVRADTDKLFNLVRGATNIAQPTTLGSSFAQYNNSPDDLDNVAFHFLDSPSTTSSTTYKIQAKTNNSDNFLNVGDRSSGDLDSVSTITVMEIAP